MNINGINPSSETFQFNNFPIGLVVLSNGKQLLTFKLQSINKFAMNLLKISPQSSSLHSDFVSAAKLCTEYFFDNEKPISLYDYLVAAKTIKDETIIKASSFIFNEEIILVKIRQTKKELFITIDTVSEDRQMIRKKLIASIKKNFLMTINHEVKNLLCGLITTLEESKEVIDSKDYTTITATVILIQKIIKLYILFTKVSFDDIRGPTLKNEDNVDVNKLFEKMKVKFNEVFLYKNIQLESFAFIKKLSIRTDYHYIKDLLFVLFFFLYYKTYDNATITMDVEYNESSCSIYFTNDNYCHQMSITGKEVTFDDEIKMNENQIKKSVMTPDIMEYLLKTICHYLNFTIVLKPDNSQMVSHSVFKPSKKKLLLITIDNINIGDDINPIEDAVKKTVITNSKIKEQGKKNSIIESSFMIKPLPNAYSNVNLNVNANAILDDNPLNKRVSLIDFQFEKKNTYDRARLKEENSREFHSNTNKTLKNCSTMSKSENAPSNVLCLPNQYNQYEKVIYAIENNDKKKHINEQEQFKSANFHINDHLSFFNSDFESSDTDEPLINNQTSQISCMENGLSIIGAYKNLFGKSKKNNNSLIVNHPFLLEDTLVLTQPISQTITNILNNDESMRKIIEQTYSNDLNSPNCKSAISDNNKSQCQSQCKCNDILVVDDEVSIARSMMKMIQSQNYDSDYCKNGRECIQKMQSKLECTCDKRYYKLILLDVYMPDWDGIATCSKINDLIQTSTISADLNVVFISGHKLKDLYLPDYQFVQGFYQKPINRATIFSILEKYYTNKKT